MADIRSLIARKKKLRVTRGLPNWGEDLPEDVSVHQPQSAMCLNFEHHAADAW